MTTSPSPDDSPTPWLNYAALSRTEKLYLETYVAQYHALVDLARRPPTAGWWRWRHSGFNGIPTRFLDGASDWVFWALLTAALVAAALFVSRNGRLGGLDYAIGAFIMFLGLAVCRLQPFGGPERPSSENPLTEAWQFEEVSDDEQHQAARVAVDDDQAARYMRRVISQGRRLRRAEHDAILYVTGNADLATWRARRAAHHAALLVRGDRQVQPHRRRTIR